MIELKGHLINPRLIAHIHYENHFETMYIDYPNEKRAFRIHMTNNEYETFKKYLLSLDEPIMLSPSYNKEKNGESNK